MTISEKYKKYLENKKTKDDGLKLFQIHSGYAVVVKSYYDKYGKYAYVDSREDTLENAKISRNAREKEDGIDFVIIDCNNKYKMVDSIKKDYDRVSETNEKIEALPLWARNEMKKSTNKKATLIMIMGVIDDIINAADPSLIEDLKMKKEKILSDLKKGFNIEDSKKTLDNLIKAINELNEGYDVDDMHFDSEFDFKFRIENGNLYIYDANEEYSIDYKEDAYERAVSASEEFGFEAPKYDTFKDTPMEKITEALKSDGILTDDNPLDWEDEVTMVISLSDNVDDSFPEENPDEESTERLDVESEELEVGDIKSEWKEVFTKQVPDLGGFVTDYTWYTDGKRHVFVFGDKDAYKPEDGDFDWEIEIYPGHEIEADKEAQEWFDGYNGFEDEEIKDVNFDFINMSEEDLEKLIINYLKENLINEIKMEIYFDTNPNNPSAKGWFDIKYDIDCDVDKEENIIYIDIDIYANGRDEDVEDIELDRQHISKDISIDDFSKDPSKIINDINDEIDVIL